MPELGSCASSRVQGSIFKASFGSVGAERLEIEGVAFCDRVRGRLAGGVTGGLIPSTGVEDARDRFPDCAVFICGGSEDDTLATWGSTGTSWRSSGGFAGVDGGGVDDDASMMGDGFARTSCLELDSGVDVSKCAGNDGGRYGYSIIGVRKSVLHDLATPHRFRYICNSGLITSGSWSFCGFLGGHFININRCCILRYVGRF